MLCNYGMNYKNVVTYLIQKTHSYENEKLRQMTWQRGPEFLSVGCGLKSQISPTGSADLRLERLVSTTYSSWIENDLFPRFKKIN